MRMLSLLLALAIGLATPVIYPTCVRAQSAMVTPPAQLPSEQSGRFSVGAGLGLYYDGGGLGGLNGLGSLNTLGNQGGSVSSVTPFGTALLEWAATRSLRLMLGASGSYTKQLRLQGKRRSNAPTSRWTGGLGIGLRWVVNPGQVVEFSPALLLGVHGGKAVDAIETDAFGEYQADYASFGADARLGFVLEHALLPQLYLRFECYLMRGGVEIRASRDPDMGRMRQGEAGMGWGLAPTLQLRLTL